MESKLSVSIDKLNLFSMLSRNRYLKTFSLKLPDVFDHCHLESEQKRSILMAVEYRRSQLDIQAGVVRGVT